MDYGAPIGFRIATSRLECIETLIIQNGNAYFEGIDNNDWWKNIKAAYNKPEMTNDEALSFLVTLGATKWQYTNGVPNVEAVSPDTWNHVQPLLDRQNMDIHWVKKFWF